MTLNLHLGLAGFPFRLQTTPAEAIPHSSWCRAHAAALAALRRGEPVAVLGRPGTGKTLLLQSIAHALREAGRRPGCVGQAGCDVVIVDEAGAVPPGDLIALRRSHTPYILAALLDTTLKLPRLRVTLDPLPAEEVARVVARRLAAGGRPADYFEPEAILELARQSGGLMRLVLVLAGAATVFAEHDGVPRVTREHVADAATMRDVAREEDGAIAPSAEQAPPRRPWRRWPARVLVGAALTAAVMTGLWAATRLPSKPLPIPAVASVTAPPRAG